MAKQQRLASQIVRVSLGHRSYNIVIQEKGLYHLGSYLQDLGFSGKVGVVTNPSIQQLYGNVVKRSLGKVGLGCHMICLPEGERAKTLNSVSRIVDELMSERFERTSALVALGGGVIGDMTGFAAAIYLRGIPFVQIATSLVAQVDSSVGGKTGVNHPLGKNMIGAFYQPAMVMVDTDTLRTLPPREMVAGLAEVIKYGMIADGAFFRFLEERIEKVLQMDQPTIQSVVKRCCEIKAAVVSKDERESGLRRILNYGHTVGHALERLGRYRTYIHGEAVGIGMVCEADLACYLGRCSSNLVRRQRDLIQRVGLPVEMPQVKFQDLWKAMLHDKKVSRGHVHCVLPRSIGKVEVKPLVERSVKTWFAGHQTKNGKGRVLAKKSVKRGKVT
ncbi:MAG: 3-dehydroquinate synthase [Nitrospirota bacterium]|nr:3-dehydroquinate synthase [Nitrospirota bacterium]